MQTTAVYYVTGRLHGWTWRCTAENQTRLKSSRCGAHRTWRCLLRRILPTNTNRPWPWRTPQTDRVLSDRTTSPADWTVRSRGTEVKRSTKWVVWWMTLSTTTLMSVQLESWLLTFNIRPSTATHRHRLRDTLTQLFTYWLGVYRGNVCCRSDTPYYW